MAEKITAEDAAKRVLATTLQAAAASGTVLIGLIISKSANAQAVVGTLLGSFAVPVLTAIHRYSQLWLAAREPKAD